MTKKRVFINAALSTLALRSFNDQLRRVVEEMGFETYLPQTVLSPTEPHPAEEILRVNVKAVEECDIVLGVLDSAGLGVSFEIGYALARRKPIIAFRSDLRTYLGKIMEGFWDSLDADSKARTLDELRSVLCRLKTKLGNEY